MEFGTREILILLGIVIILGILLDGFRRVRQAHSGSLRTSRRRSSGNVFDDEADDFGDDLFAGKVRVKKRDPDSVEQVSDAMRRNREELAGKCTSAFRDISQLRQAGEGSAPPEPPRTPNDDDVESGGDAPREREPDSPPVPEEPPTLSVEPEPEAEPEFEPEPEPELEPEPQPRAETSAPGFHVDPDERIGSVAGSSRERHSAPREPAASTPSSRRGEEERSSRSRDSGAGGGDDRAPDPDLVLVLHVMARKGEQFQGPELLEALLDNGLRYGSMEIFHRHEQPDGSGPVLFSLANSVKPGTFNLGAMDDFTTPGVTLFMPLEGLQRPLDTLSEMVDTARRLAQRLDGELKDETRSALTRQTIEHYRQQVIEYTRRAFTLTS